MPPLHIHTANTLPHMDPRPSLRIRLCAIQSILPKGRFIVFGGVVIYIRIQRTSKQDGADP
jgi:hypothetical protein